MAKCREAFYQPFYSPGTRSENAVLIGSFEFRAKTNQFYLLPKLKFHKSKDIFDFTERNGIVEERNDENKRLLEGKPIL